jgi:replicative DNA helicase
VADEQVLDQEDIYPLQMPCFDNVILGGVSPGDLVVVAGQSGHGKTSLVQDWTLSLIRGEMKAKSLWFSYEVLPTHLWKKFQEMGMTREDMAFIPCKNTSGNVAWVEQKIKEGKEKFGIKVVMIDHLGFLLPKTNGTLGVKNMSSNYSTFLTQVVRDLKTIALQEEVIIFLPVHMRKAEKGSKRSDIDDIKDSSGVAQESDLVFLIEREKDKEKDSQSYFTNVTKITLAKNRKTGTTVIANFTMMNGRFAYDDTKDKADKEFENIGKEVKVEEIQQPLIIPPAPVVPVAP